MQKAESGTIAAFADPVHNDDRNRFLEAFMQSVQAGLIFSLVCAVGAVLYGIVSRSWILGLPSGNDRMREIAAAIEQGAQAYLRRQYTTISIVGAVLFLIVGFTPALGWITAVAFLVGAVL